MPTYGLLHGKVEATTKALFEQKNFKDLSILEQFYNSANLSNAHQLELSQFYTGLRPKDRVVSIIGKETLTVIKLLLLESRVIVYS